MKRDQIIIFDTTLRDGEQALKATLQAREKLQIALALEDLGVDFIEAGFPVSSPNDFNSVKNIAKAIKNSRVAGLARVIEKDIDAVAQALKSAEQFRIHTFIATSSIHVEKKLKKDFSQIIAMATKAIKYARKYTDDVEFSCEDAGRTSLDNLCRMVEQAIIAGATTINIPDTVGYTLPSEFGGIITHLLNHVPNIDKAIISVHCHDDLGLSVANSIAAVQAGARQIECTINGIGERAGNSALEEIAMIFNIKQSSLNLKTNIKTKAIHKTSQMVAHLCNMPIQSNKAIVGENAFSHSSGIHQDGVLKSENTYEIMTPESIGIQSNQLNLTARSGRHVIDHRLKTLGYLANDYDLERLYARFIQLADQKGHIFDYDLEALVFFSHIDHDNQFYVLKSLDVLSGTQKNSTATISLLSGEKEITEAGIANGPINAICCCINRITGYSIRIQDFKVASTSQGMDALGQVDIIGTCLLENKSKSFHGRGLATDIIRSACAALIHIANDIYRFEQVIQLKSNRL
jgi:2-isopropylmalate synthase